MKKELIDSFKKGWNSQTDLCVPNAVTTKEFLKDVKTIQEAYLRGQNEADTKHLKVMETSFKKVSGIPWL